MDTRRAEWECNGIDPSDESWGWGVFLWENIHWHKTHKLLGGGEAKFFFYTLQGTKRKKKEKQEEKNCFTFS